MSKINIFALGGLNEEGKNMYVVKVDSDIFIFDAGLKYASDKLLGVDYVIPDFTFIKENLKKIKGLFLTHGHEKNMGAVCDIVKEVPNLKVFATPFTASILKKEFESANIDFKNLNVIDPHKKISFGKNSIFPVRLTHSVPDNVGYALNTKDGTIFYTGNYVFDATMLGSYKADIGKLAYIGKQGVLCLLGESMYADKVGYTSPKCRVDKLIRTTLSKTEDRIIANVFTAHISRIEELFNEIAKTTRRVVVMGHKLQGIINDIINKGYIKFDKSRIGDLSNIDDKDAVILISNEREKPFMNLNRIINGYDKFVKIKSTDTVLFLEPINNYNEKLAIRVIDDISKAGASVVTMSRKDNLLHHASSEDIMLMLDLMNPKYYMPVIGEYRHMVANAKCATHVGINKENIILKQNGDVVSIIDGKLVENKERVKTDDILIDGTSSKDIGELVLKDREMLSDNGIVIVCATLDKRTKEILAYPEVLTRGFIYVKENTDIIEEIKNISKEVIDENTSNNYVEYNKIKLGIRERLSKYLYEQTECKPMIITVIQEV
ncbi:MAG: ribonuclease J [Bacilli bacterium]|nr:ribonuclease J [Bacilli bacterium]